MNKVYAVSLVLLAVAAAAVTFLPLALLQPFKAQTESIVALSYTLFRWAPWITVAAFLLGVVLLVLLVRRRSSWWLRVPLAFLVAGLAGLAVLARVNTYERVFAPLDKAGFLQVDEAEHLVDEEMVLGIRVGSVAKAYPVGMLAYHHLVNDELAGVPLVVTY